MIDYFSVMKDSFANVARAFKRLFKRKSNKQEVPPQPLTRRSDAEVLDDIRLSMTHRKDGGRRRRWKPKVIRGSRLRVMRFNGEKHFYRQPA